MQLLYIAARRERFLEILPAVVSSGLSFGESLRDTAANGFGTQNFHRFEHPDTESFASDCDPQCMDDLTDLQLLFF
jgi:hypothetical protein